MVKKSKSYKNNKTNNNNNNKKGGKRATRKTHEKSTNVSEKKRSETIVLAFLELLAIVKTRHWKTMSYSEHKATDNLYESLNTHIDEFVEVLLGKQQSRVDLVAEQLQLIGTSTKMEFRSKILGYRKMLSDLNIVFDSARDSDLLSIRDTILADLNQFLYLTSFDKV